MNQKVTKVLKELREIESGEEMCLTIEGNHFTLYHKSHRIGKDLKLSDLKKISNNATRYGIVQLIDVSHLVHSGIIKITDGYLKVQDDIPMVFLHVLHHVKFQKTSNKQPLMAVEVG